MDTAQITYSTGYYDVKWDGENIQVKKGSNFTKPKPKRKKK